MSDKHNEPMIVREQDRYLAELLVNAVKSRALVRDMREALGDTLETMATLQTACALAGMSPRVYAGHGALGKATLARADAFLEKL